MIYLLLLEVMYGFKKCMNVKFHESENFLPIEKQLIIMVLLGL